LGAGVLVLLLAVGGALLCWTWLQSQVAAWQAWNDAQRAEEEDDPVRARAALETCLAAWPSSGQVHLHLARACRRAGDLPSARRHLLEARQLKQARDLLDLEEVMLAAQQGDLSTSEETLQALLGTRHPRETQLFEALVQSYINLRDLRNAEVWATRWLERQPNSWRARILRAQSRELNLRLADAVTDYEQAAVARPQDAALQFKIGDLLRRLDRFTDALPHLLSAYAAEPLRTEYALSLARCHRSLARPVEAAAVLDAWLAEGGVPAPGALLALRGRLEMDQQRPPEALRWLRQAEAAAPRDEETLVALSSLLRELGQAEEAERYAARARDVRSKLKQVDGLLRSLRDDPQSVTIRFELGQLLLQLGLEEAGERWLLGALVLDPDHRPTQAALAKHYAEARVVQK
jgi:tetratricopeptide (TPR) repeat protein